VSFTLNPLEEQGAGSECVSFEKTGYPNCLARWLQAVWGR